MPTLSPAPERPDPEANAAVPGEPKADTPGGAALAQPAAVRVQANNPLHGLSLEAILRALQAKLGWEGLARQIPLRCFVDQPSVVSSLKVLRKSPWARERLERLYLKHIR